MSGRSVLIGGVDVALDGFEALCASRSAPVLAIGQPSTRADRSGYESSATVVLRCGVPLVETEQANAPAVVDAVRAVDPPRDESLAVPRFRRFGSRGETAVRHRRLDVGVQHAEAFELLRIGPTGAPGG